MSAARTFRSTPFAAPGITPQSLGVPAAAYPGRVATNSDLIVAVDRQQTSLAVPLNSSDTSMTVSNPAVIVAYSLLSIDNELIKTTGPAVGGVVPISRGFDGTTAATHLAGATVSGMVDAWHHNALVAEIEAIEAALGPNLSRIPTSAFTIAGQYEFAPQTPGGALTVGTNVITLTPVPLGVNGSDLYHYLWISGGTGTPEAVLITGGTAVSGAASGTLFITCAFTHSGAWTIATATSGGKEAEMILAATGGTVFYTAGSHPMHAPWIVITSGLTVAGMGRTGTILLGDLAVTPVLQFGIGSTICNNCAIKALTVSRAAGTVPAGTVGVSWTMFQYCVQYDVRIMRSDITEVFTYKDATSGSLGFDSYGAFLDTASTAYVKISNAIEIHFYGGAWGVNGAEDPHPLTAAMIISGSATNDLRFVGMNIIPRNAVGGKTPTAVSLVGLSDLTGLITFDGVHFENFATSYFASDAGCPQLSDLHLIRCSLSDPAVQTFALNAATKLAGCSFTGCEVPSPITLTNPQWVNFTGNFITGAMAFTGGASSSLVLAANTIIANATFTGSWLQLSVSGNIFYGGTGPDFSAASGQISYGLNTVDSSAIAKAGIRTQANIRCMPQAFSQLPAASTCEGATAAVIDSSVATWGTTITGGGANHVLAYSDGTSWKVAGI
jgi:hypothetical protein